MRPSAVAASRRSATVVVELGVACALLRDTVLDAQLVPATLADPVHLVVEPQHQMPAFGLTLADHERSEYGKWLVVVYVPTFNPPAATSDPSLPSEV